jgi:hypothetical protein
MLGGVLQYNLKTLLESITFYVEIITQVKKSKKSKNKANDVFAMFVKHMNEKTPIKQNSGRGIVKDEAVARIQDIYKEDKKANE